MTPSRRRIVVRGQLSERFGAGLGAFAIERGAGETALVGEVVDVTALYGLIDRLRDLGLDLVSISEVVS